LQQGKNVLIDLEKEDIENMHTIIENSQSFGNDVDPDEVKIMSNVLYDENSLEIYNLYAEEYNFDPIQKLIDVIEELLNEIGLTYTSASVNCYKLCSSRRFDVLKHLKFFLATDETLIHKMTFIDVSAKVKKIFG
jgi:hypothetical protein